MTDLVPDEAQEPVSRHLWRPDAVYTCVETLASSDTDCGPTSITSEKTSPVYTSAQWESARPNLDLPKIAATSEVSV